MTAHRRVILVRPDYSASRSLQTRGNSTTPVAHPSTRGVCVGGVNSGGHAHASTHVCEHAKQAAGVDHLLEQVMKLTAAEQKQLLDRAAANHLLSIDSKREDRDISMWAAAVYDAFCSAIGGPGAAGVGPQVVRRLLGAAVAWKPVEQFMLAAKLQDLPVVDRQAVYNMLAELLVEQGRSVARYTGAPFSVKLLANMTANVAGLFDDAFPGYLEAGLAHVVARRHRQVSAVA